MERELNSISYFQDTISEDKPLDFFMNVWRVFNAAGENTGTYVDRYYSIGSFIIKLRFAGDALISFIVPALEHLSVNYITSPSLTINLWDSESTSTYMPPPPWALDDYSARGEIKEYNNSRFYTACNKGSGALSVLDAQTNTALWWIRRSSHVPFYESGSPLLTILHWWLKLKGRQVVHAGAVGTHDSGVLLAGKGGTGKSTSTIACLNSDLLFAGDDYNILSSSPVPYVYSLYGSGKLNADHIRKFPHLIPFISNIRRIDEEKPLLFLNRHYPYKMAGGFPVKAIFLPRITGLPDTTLTPATQAEGLRTLAPSTLFQLSYADNSSFFEIAKFVKQLPCYHLNLGTEINKIPEVFLNFLS